MVYILKYCRVANCSEVSLLFLELAKLVPEDVGAVSKNVELLQYVFLAVSRSTVQCVY
jgi:hypothetical protein